MIGHYLLTLTPEQENRVLTRHMLPYVPTVSHTSCLVQVACGGRMNPHQAENLHNWKDKADINLPRHDGGVVNWALAPATQYDQLCRRFGVARVNRAIRNRIFSTRARRELAGVRELAAVRGSGYPYEDTSDGTRDSAGSARLAAPPAGVQAFAVGWWL